MKQRFKTKRHIKKGDMVAVIAGNDKNRSHPHKVLEVLPDQQRVLVEGVNVRTRHTKPSAQNTKGGIVKQEAPIHISNVMLWDAKSDAPSRISHERQEGRRVRIAKKSGEEIK